MAFWNKEEWDVPFPWTRVIESIPWLILCFSSSFKLSNQSSTLTYNSINGIYDYDFSVKAHKVTNQSITIDGNKTIKGVSFGVVNADNYSLPHNSSTVLGVGMIGVSALLTSNYTNYLSGLLNSSSMIVLDTRLIICRDFNLISTLDPPILKPHSS
jgi:hypothetical protein